MGSEGNPPVTMHRNVGKLGNPPGLGPGNRRFESDHSDEWWAVPPDRVLVRFVARWPVVVVNTGAQANPEPIQLKEGARLTGRPPVSKTGIPRKG